MLVSHTHKFIYLKTRKTASTSVEGLLERYCTPPGHEPQHTQDEIRSEFGIVAARAGGVSLPDGINAHASASEIETWLGSKTFNSYRKIYVVRNPYDKVVSWFWHVMPMSTKHRVGDDFDSARQLFSDWLRMRPNLNTDAQFYRIGKRLLDATVIKQESLREDLKAFGDTIGVAVDPDTMPRWKTEARRHRDRHFSDYYDEQTRQVIDRAFAFDFNQFGYETLA